MNPALTAICIDEILYKAASARRDGDLLGAIQFLRSAQETFPKNTLIDGALFHYTHVYKALGKFRKIILVSGSFLRRVFDILNCIFNFIKARAAWACLLVFTLLVIGAAGTLSASPQGFRNVFSPPDVAVQPRPSLLSQALGIDTEMLESFHKFASQHDYRQAGIAVVKFSERTNDSQIFSSFKTTILASNDILIQRISRFGGAMISTAIVLPSTSERDAYDICNEIARTGMVGCEPLMIGDLYSHNPTMRGTIVASW